MPPCEKILPAHHNVAEARMPGNMVIEILADVGLVVHQEALIAEPEILDEDGVAGEGRVAPVDDVEPPQPDAGVRMQPEGDAMADAARVSLPDKAVARGAGAEAPPPGRSTAESPALVRRHEGKAVPCRWRSASRAPG